jgi:DUF2934 family protein
MTARRRWTEETIAQTLAPIAAELGRMPTRRELSDRGVAGAWSAMRRRGGLDAWRARFAARRAAAAAPSFEAIATRAYFIALERGGAADENWYAAERELLAA